MYAGINNRSQVVARALLGAVLAGVGIYTLWSYLPALVWAGIFAIALWPLYQLAHRRWPPRWPEILLPLVFTLLVGLVFILPLIMAAVEVGKEARGVVDWVLHAQHDGVPVPDWVSRLPFGSQPLTAWWQANLADPAQAAELLGRINRADLFAVSRHLGTELLHRIVLFIFTLLTLFFLFRDGDAVAERLLRASRLAFGPGGERVGRQIVASVHGTVDGLVMVGIGEGVAIWVGYLIAGAPQPTLLGALTAVAATIPFGAPLVFVVASLLIMGNGAPLAAILLAAYGFAVVFVADHFIRPFLIGGATKLPFLWVLLGILGGIETWGVLGLFVGPAVMAALILLWREWTDPPAQAESGATAPRLPGQSPERMDSALLTSNPPGGSTAR